MGESSFRAGTEPEEELSNRRVAGTIRWGALRSKRTAEDDTLNEAIMKGPTQS